MKTKDFEIICQCGSENVVLSEWYKGGDGGIRLTCKTCGNKEDI
jgi:hypothetical protein